MRRYIVLLLITGILWAQTDFEKLVLKNATTYFTKEKAIYDAKSKNLGKWGAFYGPMSTILLEGCVVLHMGLTNDLSTPSPIF